MATTDAGEPGTTPAGTSRTLASASFVHLAAAPTASAIAATGCLSRALRARDVPVQARVGPPATVGPDGGITATVGREHDHAVDTAIRDPDLCGTVYDLATELASSAPAGIALAGRFASGYTLDDHPELVEESELDRDNGIALPLAGDTPAASTLLRGPYSGTSPERPITFDDDLETVASLVVLETLGAATDTNRASAAVTRALGPVESPISTLASLQGLGELLDLLAGIAPGEALALVCGSVVDEDWLRSRWSETAASIHARLDDGPTETDEGLATYRDVPAAPHVLARLARDFETSTPAVLAVGASAFGVAATSPETTETCFDALAATDTPVYRHGRRLFGGPQPEDLSLAEEIAGAIP